MGSGLILLVIVGAWLAVLVPMGLRSHDAQTSLRGTERFSDAMRVLSRRPTGNERTALVPRRPAGSRTVLSAERTPTAERTAAPTFLEQFDQVPEVPVPVSLAVRRRRVLVVLLVWAALSAVAGYVGPAILLTFAGGLLLLAVLFVVHCRRQAVLKAEQHRRRAARSRAAGRPRQARTARIGGIPDRMPARPAPLQAPLPAPAARYDEPGPLPAAAPDSWQPVPVPLPTYVGKEVAAARPRRVLDLTRPGQWTAALDANDSFLQELEDGKDLDVILERRRAVGGW